MTLIKTSGFQPQTDHHSLKLSRSTNITTRFVLPDIALTAVIKSLMIYGTTFEPRYDASFYEVRISDICIDLVSFEFLQSAAKVTY